MRTFPRSFTVVALLSMAVPALAQQRPTDTERDDPAKPQVQTFEMVLRNAIETGGQNFTRRAEQVLSGMPTLFTPNDPPRVDGIALHEMGIYVFQVQVPSIWLQSQLMSVYLNRNPLPQVG